MSQLEARAEEQSYQPMRYGEPPIVPVKETELDLIGNTFSHLLKIHPQIGLLVDHIGVLAPYRFGTEGKFIEDNFDDPRFAKKAKHAVDRLATNGDLLDILKILKARGKDNSILMCASEADMAEQFMPKLAKARYDNPVYDMLMHHHKQTLSTVGETMPLDTRLKDGSLMIYFLDPNPEQQDLPGLLPGYSRRFQPHTRELSMLYVPVDPFTQIRNIGYKQKLGSTILKSLQGPKIRLPDPH